MALRHPVLQRKQVSPLALAITTSLIAWLAATTPAVAADSGPEFQPGDRVHFLPRRAAGDDEERAAHPASPVNNAINGQARTSAKTLKYYGGPVIPNAAVTHVLWGAGTYVPTVALTTTPNVVTFFQGVLTSPYLDMLSQYPSSTANIGHGTYLGSKQITPSAGAASAAKIDDVAIQAELSAQIKAGNLPAPNANSYYAVFFPKGKSITQGGSPSCAAGGFCAYHGTFVLNGVNVAYGVHPDMSAGSGCDVGCGASATPFNNLTSVVSHELAEAITDPAVGLATVYGPPLGWYNATYGEIGDICNAQQGALTFASGVTYTVQKEWSNKVSGCVAQ